MIKFQFVSGYRINTAGCWLDTVFMSWSGLLFVEQGGRRAGLFSVVKQVTRIAGSDGLEGAHLRAETQAVAGAMLRKDLLNRKVPRLKHDQRAREAPLRPERVEQLPGKRPVAVHLGLSCSVACSAAHQQRDGAAMKVRGR